jgi:hypothetical protein
VTKEEKDGRYCHIKSYCSVAGMVAHPILNLSRANQINLSVREGLNKNIGNIGGIFHGVGKLLQHYFS